MDMIVNGVAVLLAFWVFAVFVTQVLSPHRRSALWAAPAVASSGPAVAAQRGEPTMSTNSAFAVLSPPSIAD